MTTNTRNWIPITLALFSAAVLTAATAVAAEANMTHRGAGDIGHPPLAQPALHVGLVGAYACPDALLTVSNLETLQGGGWAFLHDDGREDIQVRRTDGTWRSVASTSGGESRRRWTGYAKATDLDGAVRIIRTDGTRITSTAKLISPCPFQ